MEITTSYNIRDLPEPYIDNGVQIVVHVFINGSEVHTFVAYSGPRADLDDFMKGNVDTWPAIMDRWTKTPKRPPCEAPR